MPFLRGTCHKALVLISSISHKAFIFIMIFAMFTALYLPQAIFFIFFMVLTMWAEDTVHGRSRVWTGQVWWILFVRSLVAIKSNWPFYVDITLDCDQAVV